MLVTQWTHTCSAKAALDPWQLLCRFGAGAVHFTLSPPPRSSPLGSLGRARIASARLRSAPVSEGRAKNRSRSVSVMSVLGPLPTGRCALTRAVSGFSWRSALASTARACACVNFGTDRSARGGGTRVPLAAGIAGEERHGDGQDEGDDSDGEAATGARHPASLWAVPRMSGTSVGFHGGV